MTWWGVFVAVTGGLLVLVLVVAALLDRRARSQGHRYHPELARVYRRRRGEVRDAQAAQIFQRRRAAGRAERRHPGERSS